MQLSQMDEAYFAKRHKDLAAEFPGSRFGVRSDLTPEAVDAFEDALSAKSEEAIQLVLTEHPYLIQYAISESGHHGTWVYPKQALRPHSATGRPGMIPDFLVITRSSLGDHVRIVELKRFDRQFSDKTGAGYSSGGHKAVSQCNGYLSHFADYIDAVRSNTGIIDLVQPSGAVILMGDSGSETSQQQRNRADFVRHNGRIQVVSYRRILLEARADVGFTERGFGLLTPSKA